MSEEEKNTKEITEDENTLIDTNVALLIAERDALIEKVEEQEDLIAELSKKLEQATDLIEEDSKAALVKKIAPKTYMDKALLAKMSVDDLVNMSKVLDNAKIAPFKSGTPFSYDKKPSARDELDSMFAKNMAKLRGGKQ